MLLAASALSRHSHLSLACQVPSHMLSFKKTWCPERLLCTHLDDIFISSCPHSTASPTHATQTRCAKSSPHQKKARSISRPSHTLSWFCPWEIWQSGTVGPASNAWLCHISLHNTPGHHLAAYWVPQGRSEHSWVALPSVPCSVSLFPTHSLSSLSLFIIFATCGHFGFFFSPVSSLRLSSLC